MPVLNSLPIIKQTYEDDIFAEYDVLRPFQFDPIVFNSQKNPKTHGIKFTTKEECKVVNLLIDCPPIENNLAPYKITIGKLSIETWNRVSFNSANKLEPFKFLNDDNYTIYLSPHKDLTIECDHPFTVYIDAVPVNYRSHSLGIVYAIKEKKPLRFGPYCSGQIINIGKNLTDKSVLDIIGIIAHDKNNKIRLTSIEVMRAFSETRKPEKYENMSCQALYLFSRAILANFNFKINIEVLKEENYLEYGYLLVTDGC